MQYARSHRYRIIVNFRHCEERSDEAIQLSGRAWIALLRSQ
jgi:hypothetical protein